MSMFTFILLCACVLGAAYAAKRPPFKKVRQEIGEALDAYVAALKENNIEGVLDIYDDDVKLLANGYATLTGKKAMRPTLAWVNHVGDARVHSEGLGPKGRSAEFVYQIAHTVIESKNGKVLTDHRSLIIWKDTDNGYKVHIVMTNGDGREVPSSY